MLCPFEVVDDFLELHIYGAVVAQLPGNIFSLRDGQVLEIHLHCAVAHRLRALAAQGPPDMLEAAIPIGGDEFASLQARVHYGRQRDHVDVTLTGHAVEGKVCLVYLSGSGTLVLTDAQAARGGTPVEHRIDVRPNRAVIWVNSRYTHRVETSDNKVPRIMLGPYTVDPLDKLTQVGANQLIQGWAMIALIAAAVGLLCVIGGLALCVSVLAWAYGQIFRHNRMEPSETSEGVGWNGKTVVLACVIWCTFFVILPKCMRTSCEWCASRLFSWIGRNSQESDSESDSEFDAVTELPAGLHGIEHLVRHAQIAFCKQCVAVGKEMLLRKMLRSEDVEERTPTLILSLAAMVTFRFCLRSSRCGDRFVFADGFEVMDSSLPEWNPMVYLFMRRVRAVRTKLHEMNVSQEAQDYMEARLIDQTRDVDSTAQPHNLDTEDLNDLQWVVNQVIAVAITVSQQPFYKERLEWITETLEGEDSE